MVKILLLLALLTLAMAGAFVDVARGRRPALLAARLF
jgi:hypothetical protein